MKRIKPIVRICLGIVLLTVSLILVAELAGFAPDPKSMVLDSRKNFCELLAIHISSAAEKNDLVLIRKTLDNIVKRNANVESVALRLVSNKMLLVKSGNHLANWSPPANGKSTADHVQIPIFQGNAKWGVIEVSFRKLWGKHFFSGIKNSYLGLILFISLFGYVCYYLLMKRILRELDPSAVIPGRVLNAFDILKEGVLIMDDKEQIVLANTTFAESINKQAKDLIGTRGSELPWVGYRTALERKQLPWNKVLDDGETYTDIHLTLTNGKDKTRNLVVNSVPIAGENGRQRGVLATFDDITELEEKNVELQNLVRKLQLSKQEIDMQYKELEFLASHDPLTLCLNRRSLNSLFKKLFKKAQGQDSELFCLMVDIDHFKSVNDTYGHAIGDQVIKAVAAILREVTRETDLIGRYGGEEFCLVVPKVGFENVLNIAERIRGSIQEDMTTGIQVTVSIGISSIRSNVPTPEELIGQADKALYIAKKSGRNRVVCWGLEEGQVHDDENADAAHTDPELTAVPEDSALPGNSNPTADKEIEKLKKQIHGLKELAYKRAEELHYHLSHDVLTGLPTRVLFIDRIKQALSRGQRSGGFVAVMSVHIDTVERITEVLGRNTSDKLFLDVSKLLAKYLRSLDTVAAFDNAEWSPTVSRIGQKEFGILLADLQEVDAITWIVKRLIDGFKSSFDLDGNEVYVHIKIGIAISPYDGDSPETLEKNATAARNYLSTNVNESGYFFYSNKVNRHSAKQLALESKLYKAIENDELIVHYQPKIAVSNGLINGFEALVRWDSPVAGMIPPAEFIPFAEQSGLISIIGDWVLEAACKQVRTWQDMGFEHCTVAVNFSAKQFRQEDLVERIQQLTDTYGLNPSCLIVEITESVLIDEMDRFLIQLEKINELGVGIALDDFGTGYSSLGYLNSLPLHSVKADRSFIANITSDDKAAALVNSIIRMAHSIGLKVTAEGVERHDQAALLKDYNCDEMQGYLFSKPVPADKVTSMLKADSQLGLMTWEADRELIN